MKIAITGHTKGIGQGLAKAYTKRGHEIVGLSTSTGHNIRNIPKIIDLIMPCDMFINNAQAGYAQTELLFNICDRWAEQNKDILVISTMMAQQPLSTIDGLDEYRVQKKALEEAFHQLRFKYKKLNLQLVRPGYVARESADSWAETLVRLYETAKPLRIPEISLS